MPWWSPRPRSTKGKAKGVPLVVDVAVGQEDQALEVEEVVLALGEAKEQPSSKQARSPLATQAQLSQSPHATAGAGTSKSTAARNWQGLANATSNKENDANAVASLRARISTLRRESAAPRDKDAAAAAEAPSAPRLAQASHRFFDDDILGADVDNVMNKRLTSRPTEYRLRATELTGLAKEAKRVIGVLLKRKDAFVNACHERETELGQLLEGARLGKGAAEASEQQTAHELDACRALLAKSRSDVERLEESLRVSEQAVARESRGASLASKELDAMKRRAETAEDAAAKAEAARERQVFDLKASARKAADEGRREMDALRNALHRAEDELVERRAGFEAERRGLEASTKEQLETMMKSLEQEQACASELREQHALLSEAHSRLERIHADVAGQLESASAEASASDSRASELERRVRGLEGELERERGALTRAEETAAQRESDLRQSLSVAEERRAALQGEVSQLKAEVGTLAAQLAAARSQAEQVKGAQKSLEARAQEATSQHTVTLAQLADIKEAHRTAVAENARLAAELEDSRSESARASSSASAEAEAHKRTSVLLASKEVLVKELQGEREALKADAAAAIQRLSTAKAEWERREAGLVDAKERLENTVNGLQDDVASLQTMSAEWKAKVSGLEEREKELAGSLADAETRVTRQMEETDAAKAARNEAVSACAVAEAALASEQNQLRATRKDAHETQAKLEAQLGEARRAHALATSDLNEVIDVVGVIRGSADDAEKQRAWVQLEAVLFEGGDVRGSGALGGNDADSSPTGTHASPASRRKRRSAELELKLEKLTADLAESESERRRLHNLVQELRGNVRVYCRVRGGDVATESAVRTLPAAGPMARDGISLTVPGTPAAAFEFDSVFDADATQEKVFGSVKDVVQSALDGYKVCLFAYGQTGSGKTHTMLGGSHGSSKGIVPRAVAQVIEASTANRSRGWEYEMDACFVEIYNEMIRDLLSPGSSHSEKHAIVSTQATNGPSCPQVSGVLRERVESVEQVEDLVRRGIAFRAVEATQMNATSSRSHTLFMLYITGRHAETQQKLEGFLCLVDLAGSERVDKSGAEGARLKEACMINKSLSSLNDVFNAISRGQKHVPYRNSKLTHLLAPCLGGDGKALMFVNLNPDTANAEESLCSLRFASTVNACELGARGGGAKRNVSTLSPEPDATTQRPATAPRQRLRAAASAATAFASGARTASTLRGRPPPSR